MTTPDLDALEARYDAFLAGDSIARDVDAASALARDLGALGTPEARRRAIEVYASLLRLRPWWGYPYNASLQAERLGRMEAAERWMLRALRVEANARTLARMTSVLRKRGALEAALAFGREAVRRFPDDEPAVIELATVFDARREYAEGLELVREAAARLDEGRFVSERAYLSRERARQLASEGEADAARALLDESARLRPDANTFLRVGLIVEGALGDPESGERWLRRAVDASPEDRWARKNLGRLLYERGHLDEALPLLAGAYEEAPGDGNGAHHYSNALGMALRFEESEQVVLDHLARAADPVDGLHRLGHLYETVGRLDDAERAWRAAVEADRHGFTKLHLDLSRLALRRERLDDADAELAEGLARDPACVECLRGRALVMAARGDMDAARAALDALRAEHPRHAALRVQASQLALERGDVPAALALAEEVAELRPPFDLEASPLGRALSVAGRTDEALPHLRRAVARDADLEVSRYADLARALDALGETAEAERARREGQALAKRLEDAAASLQGLSAATWETPPPRPEPSPAPPPWDSERTAVAIEHALLLRERLGRDERERRLLRQLEPELDLVALGHRHGRRYEEPILPAGPAIEDVDALLDELFAMDPTSAGRHAVPVEIDVRDLPRARRATEELEAATERLRLAGLARTRGVPGRLADNLFCALPPLRRRVWDLGGGALAVAGLAGREPVAVLQADALGAAELPEELGLEELRFVDLSDAGARSFPDALLRSRQLRYLSLAGNRLAKIPDGVEALTELRLLDLVGAGLPADEVSRLRALLPRCEVWTKRPTPEADRAAAALALAKVCGASDPELERLQAYLAGVELSEDGYAALRALQRRPESSGPLLAYVDWKEALEDVVAALQPLVERALGAAAPIPFGDLDPRETPIHDERAQSHLSAWTRGRGLQLSSVDSPGDDSLFLVPPPADLPAVAVACHQLFGWPVSPVPPE